MSFKNFYANANLPKTPKEKTGEQMFYETVGVKIPSLNAFTAWLILNKKIKPYILDEMTDRPYSLFSLPSTKRILYLVNCLPQIKLIAETFAKKWNI
jgi:hypothetical protein